MVGKYQAVMDEGGWKINEAREWYERATKAYDQFHRNGDDVRQYQSALKEAFTYCEQEFRRWQQDRA